MSLRAAHQIAPATRQPASALTLLLLASTRAPILRSDGWAFAVAVALTAALLVAILASLAVGDGWRPVAAEPPAREREETLVFLAPPRVATPDAPAVGAARTAPLPFRPAARDAVRRLGAARADSVAATAPAAPDRPAAAAIVPGAPNRLAVPRAPASIFAMPATHDPFSPASAPSAAERDAKLGGLRDSIAELARTRVPTREERDEKLRAAERDARNSPVHSPGLTVGGSIGLPLFSSGPSRRERVRDSVAFAENRARLERLAARARARVDSVRRADSVAARASAPRP